MSLDAEIPGRGAISLEHLVLDVNGTITDRGALVAGVAERLGRLGGIVQLHLLSANTFGTLGEVATSVGAAATVVTSGVEKRRVLEELGADRCAAIGNGANDAAMLETAALGIAVLGPEGAAGAALRAADVVCSSILEALDLLLDAQALRATLRA